MSHIFISYSKKDTRDLALALNKALNALPNITAWVDESMRAGHSWELQIETEIDRCDVFVALYSEDIHRHKHSEPESYVLTEISYAKRYAHKLIIPVMAQATQPPMSMIQEHYIDYVGLGLSLAQLVASICFEAGIAIHEPQPTPSPIKPSPVPSQRPTSLKLMPAPFDWIKIPAGTVRLKNSRGTFDVPAFEMAKYPITNAQYALFVEDGGYSNNQWWTWAGQAQRDQDKWIEPPYWQDKTWNGAAYPVVGVSWHEAYAFSQWLSAKTGETISLPTEQQWQRAAQGDDGRKYPWGNDWDAKRCNHGVGQNWQKRLEKDDTTSPVTQFADQGASPWGVVDMAGNVWEWTLSAYDTAQKDIVSTQGRVLRGGSWYNDNPDFFHTSYRDGVNPHDWDNGVGFRVARSQ